MTNFNLKLTIFGSRKRVGLDGAKSLADNFVSMCSLPFLKTRSLDTKKLLGDLEHCQIRPVQDIRQIGKVQRMQTIAEIMLADLAIKVWHEKRNHVSTRVKYVEQFQTALADRQDMYLRQDNYMAIHEWRQNGTGASSWTDPRYSESARMEYLDCLSDEQKSRYNKLFDEYQSLKQQNVKQPMVAQKGFSRLSSFVLLPFLNVAFDFDCFNLLDGCDLFLNFARIF